MTITVIHLRDIIRALPDRWDEQYPKNRATADKLAIGKHLRVLDLEKATPADIERVIGNGSWTSMRCHECQQDQSPLVRIGEEPDCDANWVDVCPECLEKAVHALATSPVKP